MITINKGQVILSFNNIEDIREFAYFLLKEALNREIEEKWQSLKRETK